MTTSDGLPPSAEQRGTEGEAMTLRSSAQAEEAARQLRLVAELVERNAPPGFNRDVVDILRRVGLMVAALTEHDVTTSCRRCSSLFTYNSARFAARHLDPPRHCFLCRQARRQERERAGVSTAVPPPQPENPR
jgi:hypothetical protein